MASSNSQPNVEEEEVNIDNDVPRPTEKSNGKRKVTEETPPEVKRRKTRSGCWQHYTRDLHNYDICYCNYCGKKMNCGTGGGTTNLNTHVEKCDKLKTWLQSSEGSQTVLNQDGSGAVTASKIYAAVFREATNELIVLAELPFSFVESLAWRYFCYKCKLYEPHCRKTATTDIMNMFEDKKVAMKKVLEQNKQRVSLTTDIWVAPNTSASYMVVTAHFVDNFWKLHKMILGFKNVDDHKGESICDVLTECLEEWGIKKVFTITVDNATANTSAMKLFKEKFSLLGDDALVLDGDHLHMRCAAHILNLVVKDGLLDLDKSVGAVRNAVHYVRSSGNRQKSFELRVDSGKITRGSLPLDCKTRWNSTHLMLSRGLKFRVAFEKMEAEDKLYNDYFSEIIGGKKKTGPPSKDDWDQIERLEKFLGLFYNSTVKLSASTSVTSHKCYNEIVNIEKKLKPMSQSSDSVLKTQATAMMSKFNKYWSPFGEMNKLLIVASVFDSSKKMKFAELCFDVLYGKNSLEYDLLKDSINDILKKLFDEYSKFVNKPAAGTDSSSSQSQPSSQSQVPCQDQASEDVFDCFDIEDDSIENMYKDHVGQVGVEDGSTELEMYLKEPVVNPNQLTDFDVLSWWKVNTPKYPVLSAIAKDILAMQVSSVASESAFSTSGRILDSYRSCLTHYTLEGLICLQQWLKAEIHINEKGAFNIQQMLVDIQVQDELQRKFEAHTQFV